MKIKKEWLIDRARKMIEEIEVEIFALENSIKSYSSEIEKTEKELEQRTEEIYNHAIEQGLDKEEITRLLDEFYASHIQDSYVNKISQQIE